jgi:hypothetical protein
MKPTGSQRNMVSGLACQLYMRGQLDKAMVARINLALGDMNRAEVEEIYQILRAAVSDQPDQQAQRKEHSPKPLSR